MLPQKEIQALFQLIDDPDFEVYDTVANKILFYGKAIIPSLEHLWETTVDEEVQERIIQLIHRVHFQDLQTEFRQWLSVEEPELLRGAILIAKYQYPELNIPFLLTQFDQIRRNLWLELNNYLTPIEKVNTFNGILYNYYKLQGHELSVNSIEHFFINKVLESKQGNVFTLGVLYIALAELLDIPIFAVAIPRQFLLAYIDSLQHFYTQGNDVLRQISFFIDSINGMIYTQNDVEVYMTKIGADAKNPKFYQAQSTVQVIYRMLAELVLCFEHHKDENRAQEIKQLMNLFDNQLDKQEEE
ncbi:MAG: transglutaminase family protein [Phycisphaerales bacterium]|nr:transglutaminase family protein [Phycisphaerales bacterium]